MSLPATGHGWCQARIGPSRMPPRGRTTVPSPMARTARMTDALKVELAERIAAKRVLVVVGTGVSLAATGGEKLASWKGLIASGVDRLVELGLRDAKWATSQKELLEGDLDDLLGVAEQVSRRLGWERTDDRCGGDWNKWLRTTVGGLRTTHPELIEVIRDLGAPLATL